MKIKIISFTKKVHPAVVALENEYRARLGRYVDVETVELRREAIKRPGDLGRVLKEEAKRLQKAAAPHGYQVVLSEKGKELDSQELAQFLKKRMQEGTAVLCFVVGGPVGLSDEVIEKADFRLSLSRLTLPHQLARLVLMETLYRSFDLLHGGHYHK